MLLKLQVNDMSPGRRVKDVRRCGHDTSNLMYSLKRVSKIFLWVCLFLVADATRNKHTHKNISDTLFKLYINYNL